MKIISKHKITFEFTPEEYFLVYSNNDNRVKNIDGDLFKEYTLNPRLDRSYKGKDDDVGVPVLFLSDEDGEKLKKYFDFIAI